MVLKIEQNILQSNRILELWRKKVLNFFENYKFEAGYNIGRIIVYIIDHEKAKELHTKFLGDSTTTDVITFFYEENGMIEAEIFINYEFAYDYAEENKLPVEDELFRYLIHGFLHVQGYNDTTVEDRSIMKEKEDEWLKLFQMFHVKH